MSEFCVDCKEAVPSCGWGNDMCNSPFRASGILNQAIASVVLQDKLESEIRGEENPETNC